MLGRNRCLLLGQMSILSGMCGLIGCRNGLLLGLVRMLCRGSRLLIGLVGVLC